MLSLGDGFCNITKRRFLMLGILVVLLCMDGVSSVAVPRSNCYALDNSSHIVDFTSWKGHLFEYEGKESDIVVRFCKDVESRSQAGYVDFGRFDTLNHFVAGPGRVDFIQGFYEGDLMNCEQSYDKLGRTAQLNIICGNCLNRQCKGELGCICSVTYESSCRVIVELAIPCEKRGPRIFEGFTIGFHPRSWEIVYNGMTQLGYEKSHDAFSFSTEQTSVTFYMTAIASLSNLVQKPTIKVLPQNGLEVQVSGSGAAGNPPTTLSPTILNVDWTCTKARTMPYVVEITIPVENYEPVKFTLTKMCGHIQDARKDAAKGWAIFGIVSCIFLVSLTLFCCGGFIYKSRTLNQHGLDALPGMTYLSALLQTFYDHSCPQAQQIVKSVVAQAVARDHRMAASLLRLHFHDCFVKGCDASLLLDNNGPIVSEKWSNTNRNSARGFEVIDEIKAALEKACPHTVSCADILAIAARDSTHIAGGPYWEVPLGRRDSRDASIQGSNNDIPAPNNTFNTILTKFKRHHLDLVDLVALSGSHTIGFARCVSFRQRLYNQHRNGKPDFTMDPYFAAKLRNQCPPSGGDQNLFPLDFQSPFHFDNSYYKNIVANKGLLNSDQVLWTKNKASMELVKQYAENVHLFFDHFAKSMVKMGNISPLTGPHGEVRQNCRVMNSY